MIVYSIEGYAMEMTPEQYDNYCKQITSAFELCKPKLRKDFGKVIIVGTKGEFDGNELMNLFINSNNSEKKFE